MTTTKKNHEKKTGITRPRPDGGLKKKTGITRPRLDGEVKKPRKKMGITRPRPDGGVTRRRLKAFTRDVLVYVRTV